MKKVTLYILVFVLFYLSRARAQTASSADVDKYYSALVKEKISGATHTSVNDANILPGTKVVPDKIRNMGNAHQSSSDKRDLPGTAAVDREKINNRNKKYLHQ